MTREQASKASLALQKIDDFRVFIDEIDILIAECEVHDFRDKLMFFLTKNLNEEKKF